MAAANPRSLESVRGPGARVPISAARGSLPRVDSLESNLSGSDPSSPIGANWAHTACLAGDSSISTTGQLKWLSFPNAEYYPEHIPEDSRVSGVRWGTVRLISPTYVLTAGHCLDVNIPQVGSADWVTPFSRTSIRGGRPIQYRPEQLAPLMSVSFHYAIDICTAHDDAIIEARAAEREEAIRVKRLVEYRRGSLDYAILELVASAIHITGGCAKLSLEKIPRGLKITITHHPAGMPRKISKGEVTDITNPNEYGHNADTLGGSSGAGVEGKKGQIGVHVAGKRFPSDENHFVPLLTIVINSPALRKMMLCYPEAESKMNEKIWMEVMTSEASRKSLERALTAQRVIGGATGFGITAVASYTILRATCPRMSERQRLLFSVLLGAAGGAGGVAIADHTHRRRRNALLLKDAHDEHGVTEKDIEDGKTTPRISPDDPHP